MRVTRSLALAILVSPIHSEVIPMRKFVALVPLLAFAIVAISLAQQTPTPSRFDGNSWWAHVKYLADDSLEGRNTGSEGLKKAQAYAVEQLQKAGLEPA